MVIPTTTAITCTSAITLVSITITITSSVTIISITITTTITTTEASAMVKFEAFHKHHKVLRTTFP